MAQLQTVEYSERAQALPGSPIRALLSSARAKLPLDLGGGIPDPALFPHKLMATVADELLTRNSALVLQYAPTEGLLPLREFIAARLQQRGCDVAPDQILITHGSQQALASVACLLTSPTQAVAIEQPVYPGAEQAFALSQAPRLALPVTPTGWDLEALHGQRAAALYVIPNHQNPTGRRANRTERERLVNYARSTSAFVIEDDAYGELDFCANDTQVTSTPITSQAVTTAGARDATPTAGLSRPLIADLPERGLLLGTFSKTLCPGLRVGWIAAPRRLVEPLVRILQATSLQPGTFAQHLAQGVVTRLDWQAHLQSLRECYARRAALLAARFAELGVTAATTEGGFFLWLRVSGAASAIAERAAGAGVLAIPERAFRPVHAPQPDRHLRVAFTRYRDSTEDRAVLERAFADITR